ncbi:hypothetical protein [Lyngbya sp. CCY1209]|nr:hypothetical protein [Lyngbya sp. CCY1209]
MFQGGFILRYYAIAIAKYNNRVELLLAEGDRRESEIIDNSKWTL